MITKKTIKADITFEFADNSKEETHLHTELKIYYTRREECSKKIKSHIAAIEEIVKVEAPIGEEVEQYSSSFNELYVEANSLKVLPEFYEALQRAILENYIASRICIKEAAFSTSHTYKIRANTFENVLINTFSSAGMFNILFAISAFGNKKVKQSEADLNKLLLALKNIQDVIEKDQNTVNSTKMYLKLCKFTGNKEYDESLRKNFLRLIDEPEFLKKMISYVQEQLQTLKAKTNSTAITPLANHGIFAPTTTTVSTNNQPNNQKDTQGYSAVRTCLIL